MLLQAMREDPTAFAAYCAATQRSFETLLNCYCREVALPEGQASVGPLGKNDWPLSLRCALASGRALRIVLPRLDSQLVIAVKNDSPTANFHYLSGAYFKHAGQPWLAIEWQPLAELLIRDLSLKYEVPFNEELLAQIQESVNVTTAILEAPWSSSIPCDPYMAYLESEQSLTYGHPFHPAPKSRQGFTADDVRRYSPELQSGFALHYFAVHESAIHEQSTLSEPCSAIVAAHAPLGLAADPHYRLVPVHPWQARWLLEKPIVAKAIGDGRIRHLGAHGELFYPTSSVRTLYQQGNPYFYKFSLHVRLTNCVRKNAVYELEGALQVNQIMRRVMGELSDLFPGTAILEEPAFLSVDLKDADVQANQEVTEGFGLILRRSFGSHNLQADTYPQLAGALFGNHVLGQERLSHFIAQAGGGKVDTQVVEQWFSAYVEQVLYPVLHCYFAHGIVFEPHLQNVVIGLRNGWPCQVFLRDFEGVKLVKQYHPENTLRNISPRARQALWYDAESGWKRIAYCLFVNNFCEAIHQLAAGEKHLEARLWAQVRGHLEHYQAKFGDAISAIRIDALLTGEPLPSKANLRNRFLKQADRAADYVALFNPLAGADHAV